MNFLKTYAALITISACILSLNSCDIVEAPYTEGNQLDTVLCPPLDFVADTTHIRKVLVEDYTGHTCGNCPRAAETAASLVNLYGEQIVVIAVHVGEYALPHTFTDGSYAADYRTPEGDELNLFFGNETSGLPNGMVNRKVVSGSPILSYNSWTSVAATETALAPEADIYIKPQYDEATGTACADVKVEFLTNLSDEYKLCVFLTEDSIMGWQKDYAATPSNIPDYVHRHMLRTSFNGTWGETVGTAPVASGSSAIKRYSKPLNPGWNSNRLHIVAFVYNASNYEIIQAEEVSLR